MALAALPLLLSLLVLASSLGAGRSQPTAFSVSYLDGITFFDPQAGYWPSLEDTANGFIQGTALTLAVHGTSLYIGGDFYFQPDFYSPPPTGSSSSGGYYAYALNLIMWNGTAWAFADELVHIPVPEPAYENGNIYAGGLNGTVVALASDASTGILYVGGSFSGTAAGTPLALNGVAALVNSTWQALGAGLGPAGNATALAVDAATGALYVAGTFAVAVPLPGGVVHVALAVASWNGVTWRCVGPCNIFSTGGAVVNSLAVFEGALFAAGSGLTVPPSATTACIARWHGSGWGLLNAASSFGVANALAPYNGTLAIGGSLSNRQFFAALWDDTHFVVVPAQATSVDVPSAVASLLDSPPPASGLMISGYFSMVSNGTPLGDASLWNPAVDRTVWLPVATVQGTEANPLSTSLATYCIPGQGRAPPACTDCLPGLFGPACTPCWSGCPTMTCTQGINGTCALPCQPNWAGAACTACASNYYGPACTSCATCHGVCTAGVAGSCTPPCDAGWTGSACQACASGFEGSADGTTCTACPTGRAGDNCTACASGYTMVAGTTNCVAIAAIVVPIVVGSFLILVLALFTAILPHLRKQRALEAAAATQPDVTMAETPAKASVAPI